MAPRLLDLFICACAAVALAVPLSAVAQPGSAGGSIGNDEKSLSGPREPAAAPDTTRIDTGAGANCVVADPTSTPLNVRTSPHGTIMGTIANGQRARILDSARDRGGDQWVYIADASGRPLGWVFRRYIICR